MSLPENRSGEGGGSYASMIAKPTPSPQPLVIVSEQGRHSQASRRIVRAQAARASAAQSRLTRARNREGREGAPHENPQSPFSDEFILTSPSVPKRNTDDSVIHDSPLKPLLRWLVELLEISDIAVTRDLGASAHAPLPLTSIANDPAVPGSSNVLPKSTHDQSQATGGIKVLQLPLALPRGFARLQRHTEISADMLNLLCRTACIDFASPGVEQRLHRLLFDLIVPFPGPALQDVPQPGHPIQGHLRIACTCLTIFQGQRADSAIFAEKDAYRVGLHAAWSEATLLDHSILTEPSVAEISLWALFIINVATGSETTDSFHRTLVRLLSDLQLFSWEHVRQTLLGFIYPVSILDEACRDFFHHLRSLCVNTV